MKVPFWKLSGAGNDFVLLAGLPKGKSGPALAKTLCDRRTGVGADGLLVMSRGRKFRLDYWNADGSAAFCGNGARCAALWAEQRGWTSGRSFSLDTSRGPLTARVTAKGRAEISMPVPRHLRLGRNLAAAGRLLHVHTVDTGVPHAVVFVPDVEKADVARIGRALRFHKAFGRAGSNVNFVQFHGDTLLVRSYERGVEAETLACGTGVVASAFVARVLGFGGAPVTVTTRGGDVLTVSFDDGPKLEGPGVVVFSGEVSL